MNYTQNYKLNQWAALDKVQRTDFNADNAKIDAALGALSDGKGNGQIVTGSYTGSGRVGSYSANRLYFDHKPVLVLVSGLSLGVMALDCPRGYILSNGGNTDFAVSWSGDAVSWYNDNTDGGAWRQMNESGQVYRYIAFLER